MEPEFTICFDVLFLFVVIVFVIIEDPAKDSWWTISSDDLVSLFSFRYDCKDGKFLGSRLLNCFVIPVIND